MSTADGEYVDGPDGTRVWKPAKRMRVRKGADGQPRPVRVPLTTREREERFQFQRDRLDVRRRELVALEALAGPALHGEGDPNVEHERPVTLDARTAAGRELARVERPNGTTLRAYARTYDGLQGGRPKFYALLCAWFRRPSGVALRSKGVAVEGPELRPIAHALLALADEYDAACAAGVEPWAVAGGAGGGVRAGAAGPAPQEDSDNECQDCGGEVPDGHLSGCDRAQAEADAWVAAVSSKTGPPPSPRVPMPPAPAAPRPITMLIRRPKGDAKAVADILRPTVPSAWLVRGNPYIVFLGPVAGETEATELGARVAALGLTAERG